MSLAERIMRRVMPLPEVLEPPRSEPVNQRARDDALRLEQPAPEPEEEPAPGARRIWCAGCSVSWVGQPGSACWNCGRRQL